MSINIKNFLIRLLSFVAPLVVLGLFELFFYYFEYWYYIIPAAIVFIFLVLLALYKGKVFTPEFAGWFTSHSALVLCSYAFLVFTENEILRHVIAVIITIIYLMMVRNIYLFNYRSEKYQTRSLENISNYTTIFIFFFAFSAAFNILIFLSWSIWILLVASAIGIFMVSVVDFWFNKVAFKRAWMYALVSAVIFTGLFWVFSYLPISHLVSGVVFAALYYMFVNICLLFIGEKLDRKNAFKYIIISGAIVVVVLVTAQWT